MMNDLLATGQLPTLAGNKLVIPTMATNGAGRTPLASSSSSSAPSWGRRGSRGSTLLGLHATWLHRVVVAHQRLHMVESLNRDRLSC